MAENEEPGAGDQQSATGSEEQQQGSQQGTPPANQGQQQSQQQGDKGHKPPQGYVPVSEVSKERKKAGDLATALEQANKRNQEYEQREEKRKFLREFQKTLGENFRIEKPEELEEVVDAVNFDSANPDKTKSIIGKLFEAAKRPVNSGPNTPMFGNVQKDGNKPRAKEKSKFPAYDKLQERLKQTNP